MAGLSGLLDIGRDALAAQAFAVNVTGQNITNVNTPGYVRREVTLETRTAGPQPWGSVEATGIRRMRDQFMDARLFEASGFAAAAGARDDALGVIEGVFNDFGGTGLGTSLSDMLQSFSALTANPSDPTTRAAVLAKAQAFVTQVHTAAGTISTLRTDLLSRAQGTAAEVNQLVSKIAILDQQIAAQVATGAQPADLQDQQGKLVEQLSQLTDVHTFTDGSGRLVIQGSGTTLLEGGQASSMAVSTALDGSLVISVNHPGGGSDDITQRLQGGQLAGIRQARDVDAVQIADNLDQLVFDVATAINTQHAAGYGLDAQNGRVLFALSGPPGTAATIEIAQAMQGHPERLAASDTAANLPGGTGNALKLASLASAPIASGGTRTAIQAYSDIVGDVGMRKAAAAQESEIREAMKAQVTTMRDSVSGVSIDEEMVSLSKYQRAYEAASKLIRTADELIAGLIQELGR
ncbi:MAG: flagellar hook-associated protein FlgK [Deltaproteobacteria bacterium]|nr:flagellar hook-associated protein FlgK [Deltaproteobacteria bacterium]